MTAIVRRLILCSLIVLLGGCSLLHKTDRLPPRSHDEWASLAGDIRAFQQRIGFAETNNFARFTAKEDVFPYCGHVPRLYLPYSYEDPAIKWLHSVTEKECRALGRRADASFVEAEAWGEIETPVTRSLLSAPLDRLLYIVLHEDCHDQFELPYGIEEALCNVIAYKAMAVFG